MPGRPDDDPLLRELSAIRRELAESNRQVAQMRETLNTIDKKFETRIFNGIIQALILWSILAFVFSACVAFSSL